MGIGGEGMKPSLPEPMGISMAQEDDLSRSLVSFDRTHPVRAALLGLGGGEIDTGLLD